jgi:hypothetical protein
VRDEDARVSHPDALVASSRANSTDTTRESDGRTRAPAVDTPNERAQKLLTVRVEFRHALALAQRGGSVSTGVDVRPVRVLVRIRGRLGCRCGFSGGGGFGCALQAGEVLDEIVCGRWPWVQTYPWRHRRVPLR